MNEKRVLSIQSCVESALPDDPSNTWKCPFKLCVKMKQNGYTSDEDIDYAINLWYKHTSYPYRTKRDNTSQPFKDKYTFKRSYLRASISIDQGHWTCKSLKGGSDGGLCIKLLYDVMPLEVIQTKLNDKRVKLSNLEYVFDLCYQYGHGKDKFFLSMNGHKLNSHVMKRSLEKLIKLGLLVLVKKGRKYNNGNEVEQTTNLASEYSLTFS